jgi:uncharacterized protein YjbJ (UPF0337 family)
MNNKALMVIAASAFLCASASQQSMAALFDELTATSRYNEQIAIDKDRIEGSAKQLKGAAKETTGKVLGDKKLETEGAADKAAGKVQNSIGGVKDSVRGK